VSANTDLTSFVREALARGVPRAGIQEALQKAGWNPEQVRRAMAAFAETEFPVPVPRPAPYLSAREAFLWLLLFTCLYLVAFNLGTLLFEFIDRAFPDTSSGFNDRFSSNRIRWSVSTLVVTLPLFLFLSGVTGRESRSGPNRIISPVRRWLTYLTLFVSASVLIGDVVHLVNSFLSGELTIRFALKVLTVGVIAGAAFWYYLTDLRTDEREVVS
jgi:hypothetical protein